ncbi:hypothetical protein [Streptomyces sp. NPDC053079]|uniref:hypothetical protein n=1 Tax=Streptomyces sp. NPDC053079 TaxID=3365697 RepID=UPI0037D4AB29
MLAAQRGLLIQSAAYTAARAGDAVGMRELTGEAAAIAKELGPAAVLLDHGGGFSPTIVQLHLVSAENSAGDPAAALAAAKAVAPGSLPSTERRARYYTDVATAFARCNRRAECIRAVLAAEHHAPQETHARPAVGIRPGRCGRPRLRRPGRRPPRPGHHHRPPSHHPHTAARPARASLPPPTPAPWPASPR